MSPVRKKTQTVVRITFLPAVEDKDLPNATIYVCGNDLAAVYRGHCCGGLDYAIKLKIWTFGYRPFILGGNVSYIVATEVPMSVPVDLGYGFMGHVITTPDGKTRIAEARTGAIIGGTLKSVKADIKKGKPSVMEEQVIKAQEALDTMDVETLEPEEFWNLHIPRHHRTELNPTK